MDSVFLEREGKLFWQYDGETLCIEPWGENSLRLHAWCQADRPPEDWALTCLLYTSCRSFWGEIPDY